MPRLQKSSCPPPDASRLRSRRSDNDNESRQAAIRRRLQARLKWIQLTPNPRPAHVATAPRRPSGDHGRAFGATGAIADEAKPGEPTRHHRPGRGFRNRPAEGEVDAVAAGPVCGKRVGEGEIDARTIRRAEINDLILEKAGGVREAGKLSSRIVAPCGDGEFDRFRSRPRR